MANFDKFLICVYTIAKIIFIQDILKLGIRRFLGSLNLNFESEI